MTKQKEQEKISKTVKIDKNEAQQLGRIMRAQHIDHYSKLMGNDNWDSDSIKSNLPTQQEAWDLVKADGFPRTIKKHWGKDAVAKRIKLLEAAVDQLKEEMKSLEQ